MTYVPRVKGMSYREIEVLANKHREGIFPRTLTLPKPVDVEQVWETIGDTFVTVVSDSLPEGIEGRTWPNGIVEISEATFHGMRRNDPRSRFTVIHECAHAILHVDQIKKVLESRGAVTLNRREDIPAYQDPEWQANAFAASYLMPREACYELHRNERHFNPHLLMEAFCVSYTAACRRIEVLMRK